jgi:hypothetical protein
MYGAPPARLLGTPELSSPKPPPLPEPKLRPPPLLVLCAPSPPLLPL